MSLNKYDTIFGEIFTIAEYTRCGDRYILQCTYVVEYAASVTVVLCPMDKCADVDALGCVAYARADGYGYFIWKSD